MRPSNTHRFTSHKRLDQDTSKGKAPNKIDSLYKLARINQVGGTFKDICYAWRIDIHEGSF